MLKQVDALVKIGALPDDAAMVAAHVFKFWVPHILAVTPAWMRHPGLHIRAWRYVDADGSVKTIELPEGCFSVKLDVLGEMASQGDTAALAGFSGWKKTRIDLTP